MKELLLQAVLDAGTCGITPPALCRWLIALTGGPVEGATGNARKFYHTPCPDVLEIWFQDTLSQQAENVICYSRISFRPLLPASSAASSTATDCRIAVEVLPPEQIYTSIPLSEMGLVGASPRLVAVDGWVVPHGSLSRGPMGSLNRAYAVLTPALTARLGVSFHTEQQAAVSAGPYDVLRQEVERLLSLCFPGGGEVEGCPLHVSLRLNEVSADCLLNTNADHRLLRFGSSGEGSAPRSAFPLYGARQPGRYRYLNITMLYPRGELETARRLFLLFAPTAFLIAVEPVGDGQVGTIRCGRSCCRYTDTGTLSSVGDGCARRRTALLSAHTFGQCCRYAAPAATFSPASQADSFIGGILLGTCSATCHWG